MSIPKISRISISFTKDEIDWLSWVMTDVLGKATHVPPHDDVAKKLSDALSLINDINSAAKEALNDTAVRESAGSSART